MDIVSLVLSTIVMIHCIISLVYIPLVGGSVHIV